MAMLGLALAFAIYVRKIVEPAALKTMLRPLWELSWHKWWFDELYEVLFVRPTKAIGAVAAWFDKGVIDGILHALAWISKQIAAVIYVVGDRTIIDRTVDGIASTTWRGANSLRGLQTGKLRQYIMFIAIGTVVLFVVASLWKAANAGG